MHSLAPNWPPDCWISGQTPCDGREVLFNRDYTPIWDRSLDNVVGSINPDTYVPHKDTVFYFDDALRHIMKTHIHLKSA